jgi:hypothetical protein
VGAIVIRITVELSEKDYVAAVRVYRESIGRPQSLPVDAGDVVRAAVRAYVTPTPALLGGEK